jgi:hypothetical protein
MLLCAPASVLRLSLRRSAASAVAVGRWARPLPHDAASAGAVVLPPRAWLSFSHTELPPHAHLKVPDFGGKGTVLKWLKVHT